MSIKAIAISGHAGHGKDTAAEILKGILETDGHKVLIAHYADLLKYICKSYFKWDGQKDEYGRTLLQTVGTDVIRNNNPNYWVDFVTDMICFFGDCWDYVIIPDTRFPNEVERLRERGVDTIHLRVERTNFVSPLTKEQLAHPSETALDNTEPDYLIKNSGSLEELKSKLEKWITEDLYEKQR